MKSTPAVRAFVGLGSNLGDRGRYLAGAVEALRARPGIQVVAASPVYETAAHTLDSAEEQAPYLNAVVVLRTTCTPEALLAACHAIERAGGRDRRSERRWAPRTLDLDLLVFGDEVRAAGALRLPHPRLAERRFVLRPLADVAPSLHVPPPFDRTVAALLSDCPDPDVPVRTDLLLPAP